MNQERQLYSELSQREKPVARCTLVQSWGSVPREVGAKMLVFPDGSIRGTVGGGCGEAEVWQAAMECLSDGSCRRIEVDLTEDESSQSGKVCGGRFEVFVDVWQPGGLTVPEAPELLLVTCLGPQPVRTWKHSKPSAAAGSCGWEPGESRILLTADDFFWPRAFADGRPKTVGKEGCEFFLDPLSQGLELIIAGAGHIARPLSRMAALCGYSVVVVDDRPEYARPETFPEARVVCQDFGAFFSALVLHRLSHVVLVTRGHKLDEVCLRALIERPAPFYLGMIGSRRRTRAVLDELRAEGVDDHWLAKIYAPIGLNIGALTPEEISISILSEMILIRRGGRGGSLRGSGKGPYQAKAAPTEHRDFDSSDES
ncbi:XdhC family protein [bacterium]|nr:XdhC family protein [bacterium]